MKCPRLFSLATGLIAIFAGHADAATIVDHPFVGVTHITRSEGSPNRNMHILQIDLTAPGIGFKLTPQSGSFDVVRQRTTDYLNQEHAQIAVNIHFSSPAANQGNPPEQHVVGLAASLGNVYSPFEPQPVAAGQPNFSYAIIPFGPAINIDASNRASVVHHDPSFADNKHVLEPVTLYNAFEGSGQIVTNGVKSIPVYKDATHPDGQLNIVAGMPYSNSNSWYDQTRSRTVFGLSADNTLLTIFTVDEAGGSTGMTLNAIADLLISDYGVYNAMNQDGGGSTSLAMEDPVTHLGRLVNVSSDNPLGRNVGSNLAIFATPVPEPGSMLVFSGVAVQLAVRRFRTAGGKRV